MIYRRIPEIPERLACYPSEERAAVRFLKGVMYTRASCDTALFWKIRQKYLHSPVFSGIVCFSHSMFLA